MWAWVRYYHSFLEYSCRDGAAVMTTVDDKPKCYICGKEFKEGEAVLSVKATSEDGHAVYAHLHCVPDGPMQ